MKSANDKHSLFNILYVIVLLFICKRIPLDWCSVDSWWSQMFYISIGLAILCLLIYFLQRKTTKVPKTKPAPRQTAIHKICRFVLPATICLCLYCACLSLLSTYPYFVDNPLDSYFPCWSCHANSPTASTTSTVCNTLMPQAQHISLFVSMIFTLFILFYNQYKDTTNK